MKHFSQSLLAIIVFLLPLTACESFEAAGNTEEEFWGESLIDKSRTNEFDPDLLYGSWEFVSTQVETWIDGKFVSAEDRDNVFPYMSLSFNKSGLFGAEGMTGGKWKYQYNCLFIDLIGHGGSSYYYEVADLSGQKLVLRYEFLSIGGPVVSFFQDPSGTHRFALFTYIRK